MSVNGTKKIIRRKENEEKKTHQITLLSRERYIRVEGYTERRWTEMLNESFENRNLSSRENKMEAKD